MTLIVLAVIVAGISIAAVYNPRQYIYLRAVAHPFAGTLIALAMLATVPWIAFRPGWRRTVAFWALGVVAAIVACSGSELASLGGAPPGSRVLDASGHFKLIEYTYPGWFNQGAIGLRIRSRNGLLSREGSDDIACFGIPDQSSAADWNWGSAHLVGDRTVAVTDSDGHRFTVTFDPETLNTDHVLDECGWDVSGD